MTQIAEKPKEPVTLTDVLRALFKGILDPIGAFLNDLGLTPNTLTIFGLVGNTIGAFFLVRGEMLIGGLIITFMGPIDALDGTMARLRGEPNAFGAFVDSVTDRYSELVTYLGLLLFYLQGVIGLPAGWFTWLLPGRCWSLTCAPVQRRWAMQPR